LWFAWQALSYIPYRLPAKKIKSKFNAVYSIQTICAVIGGEWIARHSNELIGHLAYDSRRLQQPSNALFFALETAYADGHKYVHDACKKGVRNFVVSRQIDPGPMGEANIIIVSDTLDALQSLASFHRGHFHFPVIGITGSNGKTVVKEWLYQLLQEDYKIVRSPKSFNSQIGVPLSAWQMNDQHELGIFEAGISTTGEMEKLEKLIRPAIGVLTNIGEAHNAGFTSFEEKISEKARLFRNAEVVIGEKQLIDKAGLTNKSFSWSRQPGAGLQLVAVTNDKKQATIRAMYNSREEEISIPFTDDASVQNAINCWCVLLYMGIDHKKMQEQFRKLHAVDMRLQLKRGINDCLVVNDSYSADTSSLKIALDFLKQQSSGLKRTVILSDFFETGRSAQELYAEIAGLLHTYKIEKVITVGNDAGKEIGRLLDTVNLHSYPSTDDLLLDFKTSSFFNEIVLIKGARKYGFERIASLFEKKVHQTVLEINLNALAHNLKAYQKMLHPGTKIMAMVKAFAYGSGGAEIASVLQYHNVHYLGVAYADEGVDLVKAGIGLPVMVMNAEEASFQAIVDDNLQPVLYSFDILQKFESYLEQQGLSGYPVHIEIETGMNRLGFSLAEVEKLAQHIAGSTVFRIESVFSHLAASEDPAQDAFTLQQAEVFREALRIITQYISYPFLKHMANSAAIIRHPQLQMDMVRLGIGLYGIETANANVPDLQAVATLRSTIAQLKHLKQGESVSYNRKGIVKKDSLIATVRIGYADGFSRQFGNGLGKMWINGQLAPVIGTVCMDMTMLDVTGLANVKEGDEVIIFGAQLPVEQVAAWINTIPYELMTTVSQRVKRIYFHE
jgi:alanine racemase